MTFRRRRSAIRDYVIGARGAAPTGLRGALAATACVGAWAGFALAAVGDAYKSFAFFCSDFAKMEPDQVGEWMEEDGVDYFPSISGFEYTLPDDVAIPHMA